MGSKANPGHFDCYGRALPDEPMFVLLARDPSAWQLVARWAATRLEAIDRGLQPQSDKALVTEAQQCAEAMRIWRQEHDGEWRTPAPDKA